MCTSSAFSHFLKASLTYFCSSDRLKTPVNNALKDAKLSVSNLDEVILVGGSTRIPSVQELVRKITGKDPNVTVNPDEVVSLGAAVQVIFFFPISAFLCRLCKSIISRTTNYLW